MPELPILATLFVDPMNITSPLLWLMFPLSVMSAVVYKTIRTNDLRKLLWEIVRLSALIVSCEIGLILLGWIYLTWLH